MNITGLSYSEKGMHIMSCHDEIRTNSVIMVLK